MVAVVAVPVMVALKLEPPARTFKPPELTLIPDLAVMTPTESTLTTSSYVNVPPIETLPEKSPDDATTDPTVILGVPERPVALPVKFPLKVVAVATPAAPS